MNRKRVQRRMRLTGREHVATKPDTSKPASEHAVYLYLLRQMNHLPGRPGVGPFVSGTTRVFRLNDDATDGGTHREVTGDAP